MNALRALFVFVLSLGLCGLLEATTLPTDLALQFSAAPNTNLHPGDMISFTLSVTNLGPEVVNGFGVYSSPIFDELDLFEGGTTNCDNRLVIAVADLENSFYYVLNWYAVGGAAGPPLQPGETLSCHFTLPYTQWAPAEFPLTFHPPSDFSDLDNSNNSATVVLHRAAAPVASATQVPTLSAWSLSLLALLIAASAWIECGLRRRAR